MALPSGYDDAAKSEPTMRCSQNEKLNEIDRDKLRVACLTVSL